MTETKPKPEPGTDADADAAKKPAPTAEAEIPDEVGGPQGPEPTRFGDWERKGRCIDF